MKINTVTDAILQEEKDLSHQLHGDQVAHTSIVTRPETFDMQQNEVMIQSHVVIEDSNG